MVEEAGQTKWALTELIWPGTCSLVSTSPAHVSSQCANVLAEKAHSSLHRLLPQSIRDAILLNSGVYFSDFSLKGGNISMLAVLDERCLCYEVLIRS